MKDRERLLNALRNDKVVAIATESSFGLLADARSSRAIDLLFLVKARSTSKGQPLMCPNRESWQALVEDIPPAAQHLADTFWPGPLSIVLTAREHVDSRLLVDGQVAVRMAGLCPAAELVAQYGEAVTATSANPTGTAPALSSQSVAALFAEQIRAGNLVVSEGNAPGGAPSTLVRIEAAGYRILRPGAVSGARVQQVLADFPKRA